MTVSRFNRCISKNVFVGVLSSESSLNNYVGSDRSGWGYLANKAIWHNKGKVMYSSLISSIPSACGCQHTTTSADYEEGAFDTFTLKSQLFREPPHCMRMFGSRSTIVGAILRRSLSGRRHYWGDLEYGPRHAAILQEWS